MLWSIAPKGVHSSKAIVDIAANIAVCNFNDGLKSVLEIMQVLNLTIGTTCYNFCIKTDERRIRAAERAMTAEAKAARRLDMSNKKMMRTLIWKDNCTGQALPIKVIS